MEVVGVKPGPKKRILCVSVMSPGAMFCAYSMAHKVLVICHDITDYVPCDVKLYEKKKQQHSM